MKWIGSAAAVALVLSTVTASAVTVPRVHVSGAGIPQVAAPSAQNSGAGIAGFAGNKNGPAAPLGMVSSGAVTNMAVAEQDPTNVKGLPGSKSGPPAKETIHGGL
nr:hypothetical protein [Bradyrhizobium neotropicale]